MERDTEKVEENVKEGNMRLLVIQNNNEGLNKRDRFPLSCYSGHVVTE